MSESTTSARCTHDEWEAAATTGLLYETPGTNAFDAALHKYTDLMQVKAYALGRKDAELAQERDALLDRPTHEFNRADAEWWLDRRAQIIEALTEKGLQIISNSDRDRVWLASLQSDMETRDAEMETRDAERYRWLRAQHNPPSGLPIAQVVWKSGSNPHSSDWLNLLGPENLDDNIDLAMRYGFGL